MKHPYNRAGINEGLFLLFRVGRAMQDGAPVFRPNFYGHGNLSIVCRDLLSKHNTQGQSTWLT